jgi:hypothetical protein
MTTSTTSAVALSLVASSATSTDTGAKVLPGATISEEQEAHILRAVRTLYEIVREGAHGERLPDFNALSMEEYGKVLVRAHGALSSIHKARKDEKVRAFKSKIQGVIDSHTSARRKAISDFDAELASLSPVMRQVVLASPAAPNREFVDVPMTEIVACFAQGTKEEDVVKRLTTYGYTMPKRAPKPCVRVALVEKSDK